LCASFFLPTDSHGAHAERPFGFPHGKGGKGIVCTILAYVVYALWLIQCGFTRQGGKGLDLRVVADPNQTVHLAVYDSSFSAAPRPGALQVRA
jgi:hypothetical protein